MMFGVEAADSSRWISRLSGRGCACYLMPKPPINDGVSINDEHGVVGRMADNIILTEWSEVWTLHPSTKDASPSGKSSESSPIKNSIPTGRE